MPQESYSIFDAPIGLNPWMHKEDLGLEEMIQDEVPQEMFFPSSGAMSNPISGGVNLGNVISGSEMGSIVAFGKRDFTDTTAGFIQGLDTDGTYKWLMGDASGSIDWNVTTANTLTLTNGTVTIVAGTIAGLTITATALTATSGGNTTIVSSGATAFTSGPTGSPTFTVTQAGALTSTSGTIAGWTINATTLANGTNVILDASNAALSLNSATFGADGIQLQYNAGNPRAYIGNGSTQFFQFDGTTISWGAVNSTMDAAGLFTTTSALIGGWNVVSGYIYNLQSGTPTAVPNDGVVLASGNEALLVYEDTALRLECGYLSAGVYGLKIYATNGTTVVYEVSDTQQIIAGWTFTDASLYNLASGTPTSSPNDGLVMTANATPAVIAYEDTAKRAEMGYLSAGVFGFKAYATDGTTAIFEMSDTQQMIAGWNFTNLVIRTGSTDANSNVLIDSANSLMRLGPTTGNYVTMDGANLRLRSSNYVTGVSGFTVEPTLVEAENILARGVLRGSVFQYDIISAVGGQVMVANSDVLSTDMTALDASTLTIRGLAAAFAVNDILVMRATTSVGIQEEWLRVTNIASAPTYTVTRDLAASFAADSNPVWQAGTPVVKQGISNGVATFSGGWLRLFGEGTNSPFYSVFERTGVAYNAYTERVRMGNLNGFLGYVADTFGFGVGSSAGTDANITIDPTNGIRIRQGTTNVITLDNAGNVTVNTITATGGTIAAFTIASTTISATNLSIVSGAANTARITVGTGSDLAGMNSGNAGSDIAFWSGDTFANRATAPFRVDLDGNVIATSMTTANVVTTFQLGGVTVTSSAAELNILDGVTSTTAELNILDGVTSTAAELNVLDGVSANVTAANLNTLTAGTTSNADALHTHEDYDLASVEISNNLLVTIRGAEIADWTTNLTGTSQVLKSVVYFEVESGNASGDDAVVGLALGVSSNISALQNITWDQDLRWIGTIEVGVITDQDLMWGFIEGAILSAVPADATSTTGHAMFFVQDGTLYASNANGTTQTRTDVSAGITLTNRNRYEIIHTAATNVVFKINGTTVATHTTYVPAHVSNSPNLSFGATAQAAANKGFVVYRNWAVQAELV